MTFCRTAPASNNLHETLGPRLQASLDVATAEPDRLGRAGQVGELGDDPLRSPPESRLDVDVDDPNPRRLLLIADQVAEGAQIAEVVVAEREVEERLPRRPDPEAAERPGSPGELGHRLPDRLVEVVCGEGLGGAPHR